MQYRIEFYELIAKPTADVPDAFDAMTQLSSDPPAATKVGAYMRDLWQLTATARTVHGQFRRFRMEDFPEIGRIGGDAKPLNLDDDQGLIEKNFFALHKHKMLLVWHSNGNASRPTQFAKMLTAVLGTKVEAHPVIQANGLRRLMTGAVTLRGLKVSIPRPRDATYYPEDEFAQTLFDAMGAAGGDRIQVSITTDARINEHPRLDNRIKRALKELVTDHAVTTARVDAMEDGIEHPIDLVADRITSTQEVEHEGRYASADAMYHALHAAFDEQREAIDAVLGTADRRID